MNENELPADHAAPEGPGLSRERFAEIVDQIEQAGGKLTYHAIAKLTGASKSTFGPWLRELSRARQGIDLAANYPDILVRGLKAHADDACAEMKKTYDLRLSEADDYATSVERELLAREREAAELRVGLEALRRERDTMAGAVEQVQQNIRTAVEDVNAERGRRLEAELAAAAVYGERDAMYRQMQGIESQLVDGNRRIAESHEQSRKCGTDLAALQVHFEHALRELARYRGEDDVGQMFGASFASTESRE